MKTKLTLIIVAVILTSLQLSAQKKTIAVFNFDTQNIDITPEQMGNMARLEVEKLDTFEVLDRYDVAYLAKKENLDLNECYGKLCLLDVGRKLNTNKILAGSVEHYGKSIIVTLRLIDVKKGIIEKTQVEEFLELEDEIQSMINLTLRRMLGLKYNQLLYNRLTKTSQFQNAIIAQNKNRLKLSGPRLGAVGFTGESFKIMSDPESQGGLDAFPLMFMFGYQFEIQYINQGNFQALFEIVPAITGLDQSFVFPSVSILNGLRHNVSGWEFALGPIISLTSKAKGYYDNNGNWHLSRYWEGNGSIPYEEKMRMDSRGITRLEAGFVFAVGKSFKSGKLNIPVNFYIIPSKDGARIGLSVGYNASK